MRIRIRITRGAFSKQPSPELGIGVCRKLPCDYVAQLGTRDFPSECLGGDSDEQQGVGVGVEGPR